MIFVTGSHKSTDETVLFLILYLCFLGSVHASTVFLGQFYVVLLKELVMSTAGLLICVCTSHPAVVLDVVIMHQFPIK